MSSPMGIGSQLHGHSGHGAGSTSGPSCHCHCHGTLLAAGTGTGSHPQTASRDGTTPWAAGPAHRVPRNTLEVQDVSRKNNEIHPGISGWHVQGCGMVMAQGEPAAMPWDVQIPVFALQCTDTSISTHLGSSTSIPLGGDPAPCSLYLPLFTLEKHISQDRNRHSLSLPKHLQVAQLLHSLCPHSNPTAPGAGSSLAWCSLALISTH